MTCPNRIKPVLLRDVKTEALLVFIRTTLEDYFNQIEKSGYYFQLGSQEDNELISFNLKKLLINLQDTVINSSYLRSLIENASKKPSLMAIAKKEEPLMVYYDSLVKAIENCLSNGSFWIPELVVLCLLSEWMIEEEKTAYFYPYLKQIDYLSLLNCYDRAKIDLEKDKKEIIIQMYKLSSTLISNLKNTKYKINTTRKKSKKRK